MNLKDILERIEQRLDAEKMTASAASRAATGSPDTIRNWQRALKDGKRTGVSTRSLEALAPILKTTVSWLAEGVGAETVAGVPLKGRVGAGSEIEAIETGPEFVEAPADAKPNTVAVEVDGDSMFPAYEEGTLLYYSRLLPPTDLVNRRAVVQLGDGRIFVKILRAGSTPSTWTLQSINPNFADMKDEVVEWAAPIDWIRPR